MQEWEAIFQKTISQYEKLLNRLQDRCDELKMTQVWRGHLDQAENYVNRSLPEQYLTTCEDRNLCEVNANIFLAILD